MRMIHFRLPLLLHTYWTTDSNCFQMRKEKTLIFLHNFFSSQIMAEQKLNSKTLAFYREYFYNLQQKNSVVYMYRILCLFFVCRTVWYEIWPLKLSTFLLERNIHLVVDSLSSENISYSYRYADVGSTHRIFFSCVFLDP